MLAGREAHLRLGRRSDALHAAAVGEDDLLDRGWRINGHGHCARGLTHGQRYERGQEKHVIDHAPAIVHDEDLLAARIDDHAKRCSQRGDQHRELPLLLLELLERTRPDVLGYHTVDRDRLDSEHVQKLREELCGRTVRVIDHDLRLRLGGLLAPRHFREERFAVGLADAGRFEYPADVLIGNAAQVFPEEGVLHLSLLPWVHVQRLAIEELHIAPAHVERRDTHVDAARRAEAPGVEPSDRKRRLRQVGDVNARADDAAHQPALQHSARAVLVAIHRDRCTLLEGRRVGRSKAGHELGRQVDIDDARDAEAAEKRSTSLCAPDEARPNDRARFDLFVGPDLHLCAHTGMLADDRVIADHAAFLKDHTRLQRALPTDDRAVQVGALADVRVTPDDRAVDYGADVDRNVVAQHGWPDDLGERPDLDALTQEDGPGQSSGLVDLDIAGGPHAGEELLTEVPTFDLPTDEVGVRARIFGDGPDVGPVPLGHVPVERLAPRAGPGG